MDRDHLEKSNFMRDRFRGGVMLPLLRAARRIVSKFLFFFFGSRRIAERYAAAGVVLGSCSVTRIFIKMCYVKFLGLHLFFFIQASYKLTRYRNLTRCWRRGVFLPTGLFVNIWTRAGFENRWVRRSSCKMKQPRGARFESWYKNDDACIIVKFQLIKHSRSASGRVFAILDN